MNLAFRGLFWWSSIRVLSFTDDKFRMDCTEGKSILACVDVADSSYYNDMAFDEWWNCTEVGSFSKFEARRDINRRYAIM